MGVSESAGTLDIGGAAGMTPTATVRAGDFPLVHGIATVYSQTSFSPAIYLRVFSGCFTSLSSGPELGS